MPAGWGQPPVHSCKCKAPSLLEDACAWNQSQESNSSPPKDGSAGGAMTGKLQARAPPPLGSDGHYWSLPQPGFMAAPILSKKSPATMCAWVPVSCGWLCICALSSKADCKLDSGVKLLSFFTVLNTEKIVHNCSNWIDLNFNSFGILFRYVIGLDYKQLMLVLFATGPRWQGLSRFGGSRPPQLQCCGPSTVTLTGRRLCSPAHWASQLWNYSPEPSCF